MDSKRQRREGDDAVASTADGPTPMDAAEDSVDGVLADAAAAKATPDDAAAALSAATPATGAAADDEEEKVGGVLAGAGASDASDDDERMCRYCFDDEGPLISPCKCKGGQAFVHLSCLRRWQRMVLVSQPTHPRFYKDDARHHVCNVRRAAGGGYTYDCRATRIIPPANNYCNYYCTTRLLTYPHYPHYVRTALTFPLRSSPFLSFPLLSFPLLSSSPSSPSTTPRYASGRSPAPLPRDTSSCSRSPDPNSPPSSFPAV